jgi:hypothetical protein
VTRAEVAELLATLRAIGLADYQRLATQTAFDTAVIGYHILLEPITMPLAECVRNVADTGTHDLPSAPELVQILTGQTPAAVLAAATAAWNEATERVRRLGTHNYANVTDHPWTDPIAEQVIRERFGVAGICGRDPTNDHTLFAQFRDIYTAVARQHHQQRCPALEQNPRLGAIHAVP